MAAPRQYKRANDGKFATTNGSGTGKAKKAAAGPTRAKAAVKKAAPARTKTAAKSQSKGVQPKAGTHQAKVFRTEVRNVRLFRLHHGSGTTHEVIKTKTGQVDLTVKSVKNPDGSVTLSTERVRTRILKNGQKKVTTTKSSRKYSANSKALKG